jgi:hypothetical protein
MPLQCHDCGGAVEIRAIDWGCRAATEAFWGCPYCEHTNVLELPARIAWVAKIGAPPELD